jgi:hypothetical protein
LKDGWLKVKATDRKKIWKAVQEIESLFFVERLALGVNSPMNK